MLYETLCAAVCHCVVPLGKYSLADVSYVPQHRRYEVGSSETRKNDSTPLKPMDDEQDRTEMRNGFVMPSYQVKRRTKRPETKFAKSHMKLMVSQRAESLNKSNNTENTTAHGLNKSNNTENTTAPGVTNKTTTLSYEYEYYDEWTGFYGDYQLRDGGCGFYELQLNKYCYFVSKSRVTGYGANSQCAREFPGAEFAVIDNYRQNYEISRFVGWLYLTTNYWSPVTADRRYLHYVYFKLDPQDIHYFENEDEHHFKHVLCGRSGCPCTAMSTFHPDIRWHKRFCATRHYAVCRRLRVRHERVETNDTASTEWPGVTARDPAYSGAGTLTVTLTGAGILAAALLLAAGS